MPLAVQAHLLAGQTIEEQFQHASALGVGVELSAEAALADGVAHIMALSARSGVRVAALNAGLTRVLHPEFAEREAALTRLRQLMGAAVDVGAQGVVFMGNYAPGHVLPDLHPYKSAVELEAELLITQLRTTLLDLADAMGTQLLLEHGSSGTTALLRRLGHAGIIRDRLNDHASLGLVANLYHMTVEHDQIAAAFAENAPQYVHVSNAAHTLPVSTSDELSALASALKEISYTGWVTLEAEEPGDVARALDVMRTAGLA
jgi:sugar phosphate isomerase/epimerase